MQRYNELQPNEKTSCTLNRLSLKF